MRSLPLFAAGCLLLAGCTVPEETVTTTTGDEPDAAAPGVLFVNASEETAPPREYTTAILEDGTYQHARLEVALQTTVVWWNVDDAIHSVVSDDGQFAGSGPVPPDGEFVRTFQTPGEYPYHCRYHPAMRAVLVVA